MAAATSDALPSGDVDQSGGAARRAYRLASGPKVVQVGADRLDDQGLHLAPGSSHGYTAWKVGDASSSAAVPLFVDRAVAHQSLLIAGREGLSPRGGRSLPG